MESRSCKKGKKNIAVIGFCCKSLILLVIHKGTIIRNETTCVFLLRLELCQKL